MEQLTLSQRDKKYVWHPFTQMQTAPTPLPVLSAKDAWLYLENGERMLDANSSWWTVLHGHGNEIIGKAIAEQFKQLDHVIFAGVTHPKAVEAAERITQLLPEPFSKVFYSDNGSTSVEVAIKMVYQFWHNKGVVKKRFLAFEGAYHGDTFGAMSMSQRGNFNAPFEHLFFDVDFLPLPDDENYQSVLNQAETLFKTNEFAGFIFEPLVQGAAGMRIYKAEYLSSILKLAKAHEVLTIADEVMTGFYRTGTLFAIEQLNETPDIICLSKGITGGILPIGLTVATESIYNAFLHPETIKALLHGHSFTGNPLSCAAVCASLTILMHPQTVEKINTIGTWHQQFALRIQDHPAVASVKTAGTILSLTVSEDTPSGYFSTIREKAFEHFINRNIYLRPLGNVIFVNAPYCITLAEMEAIYQAIEDFLET